MKAKIFTVGLALALAVSVSPECPRCVAAPVIPEAIYQWVMSSDRMNYFFNKQEISYGVDENGNMDMDTLLVPVVKTYDYIQIRDVIEKRTWRMEPTDALADLAGEANYLTFSLSKGIVTVNATDLLDSLLTTLEHTEPGTEINIAELSEKSLTGVFYRAILAYEEEHREEIASRTREKLKKAH